MRHLLFIALLAVTPAAIAQNWVSLLKNGPAERFDEEDLRIFMDTARKALAEGAQGQTLSWENKKTRARGEMTVLRTYEYKGLPCKEVKVHNEAQGRKGTNNFDMCEKDGKWRLLSGSQAKKAK
jgi:surface antigen